MISSFRKALTVTRYAAGSYVDGRWVEGVGSTFTIKASVQPLSDREMQLLPEARRNTETYNLFTDTQLRTAEQTQGKNADRVSIYGEMFEVLSVGHWQNDVLNHFKIVVSKLPI
jgi:hypothetical protein